jgi:CHASE2 domain-containing sensor protein
VYSFVWRHLPGPLVVRAVLASLLLAAAVAVLFGWVFPVVAPHLPFNNGTVSR